MYGPFPFPPLPICNRTVKLCSGLKFGVDEPGLQGLCRHPVPGGLLLGPEWARHSCLAAKLQCDPQLVAFAVSPAAGVRRISAAVLLHPWQWCKAAVTAVFKHRACRRLYSVKILKGTPIAGAEKVGFDKLLSISSRWCTAVYYEFSNISSNCEEIREHIVIIIIKVTKQLSPSQSSHLVELLRSPPKFLS